MDCTLDRAPVLAHALTLVEVHGLDGQGVLLRTSEDVDGY